jgi:short-subunit dehydrogenase
VTDGPRVLLVTGASSGIGRAVTLRAAARGDHLVLLSRSTDALTAVAAAARDCGAGSVLTIPTDVGDDEGVAAAVTLTLAEHERIDAVVHCAGVVSFGRAEEVPVEVFDGVLRTNLHGSVNVARHVVPVLRRQRRGTLVLLGSVIGHMAVPSMSPYVVSKWGVRALARQLQIENRDLRDVRISHVAPGPVDTPIYQQAANYTGSAGRPPPPVVSPESVARQILRVLDHPKDRVQTHPVNHLLRLGFGLTPRLFDLLVGPLYTAAAVDESVDVDPTPGNVLEPLPAAEGLHGDPGSAALAIGRTVARQVRSVLGVAP